MLDLAARTGSDAIIGLIEDVTTFCPEFSVIPAQTRAGTSYKVTRRVALPPAGFRDVNGSVPSGKSQYVQDLKEMYFLDSQLQVDEAIVKADDRTIGSILADEAVGGLESAVQALGSQVYYGVAAHDKGFAGLESQLSVDTVYAGGTSNTTSAYLVDLSRQGVNFVVGRDGAIEMPDWTRQKIDGKFQYVTNISCFIGLQVASAHSVYRVRGIDISNKLTDALGAACLKNVPLRRRGSNLRWFMNRTAAYSLQISRSAIAHVEAGVTGLPAFAPLPTELAGVPIVLTDSLEDTETTTNS